MFNLKFGTARNKQRSAPRTVDAEKEPPAHPVVAPAKQGLVRRAASAKNRPRPRPVIGAAMGASTRADVVVAKRTLERAVGLCQRVGDRKSTLPVLGCVRVEVRRGGLEVAATDLSGSLVLMLPAEIQKPGGAVLNARDLLLRLKNLKARDVGLAFLDDQTTTLQSWGSDRSYKLCGHPLDEFPQLPPLPNSDLSAGVQALDSDALGALIERTQFAASTDESRMNQHSALFEFEGRRARMVATDGHRLCKMEVDVGEGRGGDARMLIPLKGLQDLGRVCSDARATASFVEVRQSASHGFFLFPDRSFSVKLVDAEFPPYEKVIPAATDNVARTSRARMVDAVKAVSVAASDRTGGVRLTLKRRAIHIESESAENGGAFDKVPAEYAGPEVAIGLNAKYLLDALGAMRTDEVYLHATGKLDPALLRPSGDAGEGEYTAVIMPMRI